MLHTKLLYCRPKIPFHSRVKNNSLRCWEDIAKATHHADRFLRRVFAKAGLNINQWSEESEDKPVFSLPALSPDRS